MVSLLTSLKAKLLLSYLLCILLAGLLAGLSFWFFRQREELVSVTIRLDKLHIRILHSIENQRDFIYYETSREQYFASGESEFLQQRNRLNDNIVDELQYLCQSEEIRQLHLQPSVQKLSAKFSTYQSLSDNLVKQLTIRGFVDYGLEGQMRRYAHALENVLDARHKAQLLTLRRHEKDYIIRKDTLYTRRFENLVTEMYRSISLQSAEGRLTDSLLTNYLLTFRQMVATEKVIGTSYYTGLQGDLEKTGKLLGQMIMQMTRKANLHKSALLKELKITFICSAGLALVLGLMLNYLLAAFVTKPILSLSKQMNHIVENNFENRLQPMLVKGTDEVALLTGNYNRMVEKIHQNLMDIQETSCMLESQNEELLAINTQLSESEEELRKLNAVKDKFFFMISHDLRGPLCTMEGFLSMLRQYVDSFTAQEIKEFAANMETSVKRLLELLSNLIQWSASQSGDLRYTPAVLPLYSHLQKT